MNEIISSTLKEMGLNPKYAMTILRLASKLSNKSIPYTLDVIWDGLQIRFPWSNGDLVCHFGSYGNEEECVESYCCPWDDGDVSCLTIEEALDNIVEWYREIAE